TPATWADVGGQIGDAARSYAEAARFEPKPGRLLLLPGGDGISGVLFGIDAGDAPGADSFLPGKLADTLPKGAYRFANAPNGARLAALAFALGGYRFDRYRKSEAGEARLALANSIDSEDLTRIAEGVTLARD